MSEGKEHFFAGVVKLAPGIQLLKFMFTHGVDGSAALNLPYCMHLQYNQDDILQSATLYCEGEIETDEHLNSLLTSGNAIGSLKYRDIPVYDLYYFEPATNGIHQLGGFPHEDFAMPPGNFIVPFQYIGCISNNDSAFSWLPFPLHLVCPVFLAFNIVYLDYSDPLKPVVVNLDELENTRSNYANDLRSDSDINYKAINFETKPADFFLRDIGSAGVPNWIQDPEIPVCPKTNRMMRFVCQLQSGVVDVNNISVMCDDRESYRRTYSKLNFWEDGDLYVFFEPESRVAAYLIQDT